MHRAYTQGHLIVIASEAKQSPLLSRLLRGFAPRNDNMGRT
jgi:hypothetical protein